MPMREKNSPLLSPTVYHFHSVNIDDYVATLDKHVAIHARLRQAAFELGKLLKAQHRVHVLGRGRERQSIGVVWEHA